jgi:hypothetical protein
MKLYSHYCRVRLSDISFESRQERYEDDDLEVLLPLMSHKDSVRQLVDNLIFSCNEKLIFDVDEALRMPDEV